MPCMIDEWLEHNEISYKGYTFHVYNWCCNVVMYEAMLQGSVDCQEYNELCL